MRNVGVRLAGLVAVFASISACVPNLQRAQMAQRETGAIRAITTIHQAEVQYQSVYGRYAVSLIELGPPATGAPTAASADLIMGDLAQGTKEGYKFSLTGNKDGYVITALPEVYGTSGSRTFFSDQTLVLRENRGPEPATANSQELK